MCDYSAILPQLIRTFNLNIKHHLLIDIISLKCKLSNTQLLDNKQHINCLKFDPFQVCNVTIQLCTPGNVTLSSQLEKT